MKVLILFTFVYSIFSCVSLFTAVVLVLQYLHRT